MEIEKVKFFKINQNFTMIEYVMDKFDVFCADSTKYTKFVQNIPCHSKTFDLF